MADANDQNIWGAFWWAVGGGMALTLGALRYAVGVSNQVREDLDDRVTKIEEKTVGEHAKIWGALAMIDKAGVTAQLQSEQRFVTKDDLDRFEERLNTTLQASVRAMLREHETNIQDDVARQFALRASLPR